MISSNVSSPPLVEATSPNLTVFVLFLIFAVNKLYFKKWVIAIRWNVPIIQVLSTAFKIYVPKNLLNIVL